jgi:hypothetical protein
VSTCPILFAWDGRRFQCVSDLLDGGGLGYYLGPGAWCEPDRDEALAIDGELLKPREGAYRLVIAEPMDEVAYLDQLTLDVVDRPPGVSVAPDERFVVAGRRPTGELFAWKKTIEPVRSTDLEGHDLTDILQARDRRTADGFKRLEGWNGYAEEHGIVLDFGDRLSPFTPADPLILCLAGWVEFPFSQTNYAAATAGIPLRLPVLERQQEDGSWKLIEANPGCPSGLPKLTTLDLTGKLVGPRCVIRLRTNLECYWDQAFVAVREPGPDLRIVSLPVSRAVLGYRGYTMETSPDGRMPMLYDYETVVPMPLARMSGRLTRYGDVAPLLQHDDDQLCLVGPGDEVRVEFDAKAVPSLPSGWSRSYVLRAVGYCKDDDLFTATGDSVEPLPWKGMTAYPFGPEGRRPEDPAYRAYLEEYQTRKAGIAPTPKGDLGDRMGQPAANPKDAAEKKPSAAAILALNQTRNSRQMLHAKAVETGIPELDPVVSYLRTYYADVIKTGKPLVVRRTTTLGALLLGTSYEEFAASLLKQGPKEIPPELIKDFCDKNVGSRPVWPELGRHLPLRLLTHEESESIFTTSYADKNWQRFYEKYPGSPGIIELSRVGLSRNKEMAMFYWGFNKGSLNGHGHILIMKRQGGDWIELPVSIGGSWES